MSSTIILFSLFVLVGHQIRGQSSSTFSYKIRVDEVDLTSPDMPQKKITILRDFSPHPPIIGKAWTYPDIQNPVAFVSGMAPTVEAKFFLDGCTNDVWAKGDGPEGFDPVIRKLSPLGEYPAAPLPVSFMANKVRFFEPFEINWSISSTPNGPWIPAGASCHPLYVTHGTLPLTMDVYHSLIYYGCKNSKDLTDPNAIVDNMYTGTFSNRTLPRKDSPTKPAMQYWAWPDVSGQSFNDCFTVDGLLKFENGRCEAWTFFFIDMMKTQGIAGAELSVVEYKPNGHQFIHSFSNAAITFFGSEASNIWILDNVVPPYFFVKSFDLNQKPFQLWNREWMPFPSNTIPLTLQNGNILEYAPENGVPSQGNSDPLSTHVNHGIAKYNGKYYDPSYGTPIQNSKNNWENISIDAMGSATTLFFMKNHNGIWIQYPLMYIHETNTPTLQLSITP